MTTCAGMPGHIATAFNFELTLDPDDRGRQRTDPEP